MHMMISQCMTEKEHFKLSLPFFTTPPPPTHTQTTTNIYIIIINFRCRNSALIAKSLMQKGADVNQPEHKGWTALHFAASKGHTNLASILLEHGANIESMVRL